MASVLMLSGCLFGSEDEEGTEDGNENEEEMAVVPQVPSSENYYQSILGEDGSYVTGATRGVGVNRMGSRLDLDRLELGLTDLAKDEFSTEDYVFREGQLISRDELNSWLGRYSEGEEGNPLGLNPPLGDGDSEMEQEENSPLVLSHLLEHNYLVEGENGSYHLGGIVVGLSLNSEYDFRVTDDEGRIDFGNATVSEELREQVGTEAAEQVVERLRTSDEDEEEAAAAEVPIMVALFTEESGNAVGAGSFSMVGVAEPGDELSWQELNQESYVFPSSEANENRRPDVEQFERFQSDIQNFFPDYDGVVGRASYENDQLQEITVDVTIRFQGKAEVVALTQYIAGLVQDHYDHIYMDVNITSVSGHEAVVVSEPGEEPMIHVFN